MTAGHFSAPGKADAPAEFATMVHVRWSDLDPNRHVNNAKVITLLEEAKLAWHAHVAREFGVDRFAQRVFVVNLTIDYRAQIRYGHDLRVAVGLERLGTSSFTLRLRAEQQGVVVVEGRSTQVQTDADGASAPFVGHDRAILEHLLGARGAAEGADAWRNNGNHSEFFV